MNKAVTESLRENFSIQRLWLLIRGDVHNKYRSWLRASIAFAIMILVSGTFFAAIIRSDNANFRLNGQTIGLDIYTYFYPIWFAIVLAVMGLLFSGQAFPELHDKTRNESYLLIPASSLEKTLARLFISTVGLVAYLFVFMFLVSVISEILKVLILDQRNPFFNPFTSPIWEVIFLYLFFQSIFFLGAAWFRKLHIVNTVIVLTLFALLGSLVAEQSLLNSAGTVIYQFWHTSIWVLEQVFAVLIPITCWTIAWLRIRKTQVSEGI